MLSEAVKLLVSRRDNGAGRLFQTRGPATAKLLSSNWVLVRGISISRSQTSTDFRHQQTVVGEYGGARPCRVLYARTLGRRHTQF